MGRSSRFQVQTYTVPEEPKATAMDVDTLEARAGLGWEGLPFAFGESGDGELHSSAG